MARPNDDSPAFLADLDVDCPDCGTPLDDVGAVPAADGGDGVVPVTREATLTGTDLACGRCGSELTLYFFS